MVAEILVIVVFPALLAVAAGWDLGSYTIPNVLPLALTALFFAFAASCAMPFATIGWHLLAGTVGLTAGFVLFALNWIGGGDAKLFAAASLWLGWNDMALYALVACLCGGALTLTLLTARGMPLPAFLASHAWVVRLHDRASAIPYGVALAAGAVLVLPGAEIFRLAAAG